MIKLVDVESYKKIIVYHESIHKNIIKHNFIFHELKHQFKRQEYHFKCTGCNSFARLNYCAYSLFRENDWSLYSDIMMCNKTCNEVLMESILE